MSDEQAPYRSACNVCGRQWIDGKEVASGLLESQTIDQQRTLADYRPQHDWGCSSRTCRCGYKHAGKRCATSGNHEFHDFDPWPCSCGLDALIAAVRHSGAPK